MIEIKSRYDATKVLYTSTKAETLRAAVIEAVAKGAYLTGANLTGANLTGADLTGAYLTGTVLTGADLTGAHLTGAPVVPNLHTKILAAIGAGGALDMSTWHTCETTHCRAGWAIALAGPEGAKLEAEVGPAMAGALITLASCPWMNRVPDFYSDNATARADIEAQAAKES